MRILLIWSGHSVSTIDVARGYSAALRQLGHEVCDANLHNWYAYHSVALDAWHKRTGNDIPAGYLSQLATEQVGAEIVKFVPDVVLAVCGLALHVAGFDMCWRLGVPMALILTESPYLDVQQVKRVQHQAVKLVFVNDRVSVEPIRDELARLSDSALAVAEQDEQRREAARQMRAEVVYLPHSFDPERHYPAQQKHFTRDVYFYGTWWPERKRLLRPLKRWTMWRHPFWRVDIGGIGFDLGRKAIHHARSNADLAEAYRHARIALNHHRSVVGVEGGKEVHVREAYSIGPRAYEIAACGAFQLCDDTRPELAEVFGDAVPTYRDADSLREQVAYWLDPVHEQEREDRAWASYQRVQRCAFETRAREIVVPALEGIV